MIRTLKAVMAGLKTFPRFEPVTSPERVRSTTVLIAHSIAKPVFSDGSSQY
jgi:hypothetical protein